MRARRRLAAAVLLLLLLVGGALWAVLGRSDRASEQEHAAAVDGDDGAVARRSGRSRRHVRGDARGTQDAPLREPDTRVERAVAAAGVPAAPANTGPPTTGPIRIRRDEPSGAKESGALRIRIDDGAGAARDDVRVTVIAATDGRRGSVHDGEIGPQGVALGPLDAGCATIALHAGSLSRTTHVRIDPGLVTEVDLTLARGATVTGEVRHREHGLLPYVRVTVGQLMRDRGVEGTFHDTLRGATDARGIYHLTGVPRGTHVLTFQGGALGFRAQPRSTLVVPGADDVRHDVLLGNVSLAGVVMDAATRRPIVGAEVQVQSPHFAMTTTDSAGRYEFVDLTPGEHRLCAAKDGYGVLFTDSGAVRDGRATRRDLLLVAAAQLTLRLRDAEGAAITAEAILSFTPAEDESGTRVTTNLRPDASGVLRYDKALPAHYVIAVTVKGYESGRVKTKLSAGANDIGVVLRRKEGAEQPVLLEGVLRDAATGAPVAGARIEPRGTAAPYTTSDAAGRFTVRGSGERPTSVVISRDGYGVEFAPVPAEGTFEMALRRAAELVLRVRGSDGAPYVGRLTLGIHARDERGTRIGTGVTADASGTALYRRILPGRYDLTVRVDGGAEATLDVEIQPGRNEFDIDLR